MAVMGWQKKYPLILLISLFGPLPFALQSYSQTHGEKVEIRNVYVRPTERYSDEGSKAATFKHKQELPSCASFSPCRALEIQLQGAGVERLAPLALYMYAQAWDNDFYARVPILGYVGGNPIDDIVSIIQDYGVPLLPDKFDLNNITQTCVQLFGDGSEHVQFYAFDDVEYFDDPQQATLTDYLPTVSDFLQRDGPQWTAIVTINDHFRYSRDRNWLVLPGDKRIRVSETSIGGYHAISIFAYSKKDEQVTFYVSDSNYEDPLLLTAAEYDQLVDDVILVRGAVELVDQTSRERSLKAYQGAYFCHDPKEFEIFSEDALAEFGLTRPDTYMPLRDRLQVMTPRSLRSMLQHYDGSLDRNAIGTDTEIEANFKDLCHFPDVDSREFRRWRESLPGKMFFEFCLHPEVVTSNFPSIEEQARWYLDVFNQLPLGLLVDRLRTHDFFGAVTAVTRCRREHTAFTNTSVVACLDSDPLPIRGIIQERESLWDKVSFVDGVIEYGLQHPDAMARLYVLVPRPELDRMIAQVCKKRFDYGDDSIYLFSYNIARMMEYFASSPVKVSDIFDPDHLRRALEIYKKHRSEYPKPELERKVYTAFGSDT